MSQIGSIFKEARIKSGKTIEDAVKETKIAKKYLVAIENEDFDIFPGETYSMGFIRNYSQFLGLDPDEMIKKYKDYKIQEQPSPIEQLTARPKNIMKNLLIKIIIVIVVLAVIYVFAVNKKGVKEIANRKKLMPETKEQVVKKTNNTVFEGEEMIKDFKPGDIIEIPIKEKIFNIKIDGINKNLDFSLDAVPFTLSTDERVEIDFDRDGKKDILLRTNKLNGEVVNITLKKLYRTDISIQEISKLDRTGHPDVVIIKEEDHLSEMPIAPKTGFKIVSGYETTEISTVVKANHTAYIGYFLDDGKKQDALLKNGNTLSFAAKNLLRVTAANAGAINIEINKIPVTLGKNGEIVAKVVRWYRDSEDKYLYHLVLDNWEE